MQNAIQWEIEKRIWLIDRLFSHRSSCQTLPVDGTSAVYIRTGCHISLLGAIAGATLYARSKTLPAASHARHLQCLPSAAQWLHVLRGEIPRTRCERKVILKPGSFLWFVSLSASYGRLAELLQFEVPTGWLFGWSHVQAGKSSNNVHSVRSPPRLIGTRHRHLQLSELIMHTLYIFIYIEFLATLINSILCTSSLALTLLQWFIVASSGQTFQVQPRQSS